MQPIHNPFLLPSSTYQYPCLPFYRVRFAAALSPAASCWQHLPAGTLRAASPLAVKCRWQPNVGGVSLASERWVGPRNQACPGSVRQPAFGNRRHSPKFAPLPLREFALENLITLATLSSEHFRQRKVLQAEPAIRDGGSHHYRGRGRGVAESGVQCTPRYFIDTADIVQEHLSQLTTKGGGAACCAAPRSEERHTVAFGWVADACKR